MKQIHVEMCRGTSLHCNCREKHLSFTVKHSTFFYYFCKKYTLWKD